MSISELNQLVGAISGATIAVVIAVVIRMTQNREDY